MSDLPPAPKPPAPCRAPYLSLALIFVVVVVAFFPALQAGFIDWDEDPLLIKNFSYRGLGPAQLRWMFTTTRMGHYMPLTWISYGWDYAIWGLRPFGYHLTNLLIHAMSAAVLYLIAHRLLTMAPSPSREGEGTSLLPLPFGERVGVRGIGALAAALLWAVHPLRVESVAWVTERRDVLSGLFFLLAVWAYLGWAAQPRGAARWRLYGLGLGCFALGLLAKGMAATLPAVLLLLDVYPLKRITDQRSARRALVEKIPFIVLAVIAVAVGLWAVLRGSGMTPVSQLNWAGRVAISLYAVAFYLGKMAWPVGLSPLYELPVPLDPAAWPFLLSGAVVAAITVTAVALRRRWPALPAAWVAYVVTLLPVIGLAHNGYQIAADRYTYLPTLGLALLAGGIVTSLSAAIGRARFLPAALAALAVVALGVATWKQAEHWHDGAALWRHALTLNPASGIAHANLGGELIHTNQPTEAIKEFDEAIRLRPNYPEAHLFFGVLLAQRGNLAAADAEFRRALELRPGLADAHNNLGVGLARAGRLTEALEQFGRAAALEPDSADVRNNLGLALAQLGRLPEAEVQFEAAARLKPGFREAEANLARARQLQGK
ncbi:MAG TPA: tetratricopeptide repeat protein [Methylomirabilota bacterium]|nr:tetratricopeptide repeat protein [Methylomirabilota bacterium]